MIESNESADTLIAIWLQDLASTLANKDVQLQGVDISSSKLPPEKDWTPNMHFQVGSVTKLPEEWTNRFDVVNQRFLIAALTGDDWVSGIAEIYRVLKPGGVAQFVEREWTCPEELRYGPIQTYYDFLEVTFNERGLVIQCASSIPKLAEKAGFVNIKDERKVMPVGKRFGEMGEMGRRVTIGAFRNFREILVGGSHISESEYEELVNGVERVWDEKGEEIGCRIICAYKPL